MDDLFSVKLNCDSNWEMDTYHFHNDCEILFIVSGECECLIETDMVRLREGTVLPLYSTTLHKTNQSSGGEYSRYVLHFSIDDVALFSTPQTDLLRFFRDGRPIQLNERTTKKMIRTFEALRGEGGSYGQDIRRRNAFFELLVKLGEMNRADLAPQKINTRNFSRIKPILAYIMENPTEPLTLSHISERFHFNKQYLCRIFKKTTGVSVGDYITSVRIQLACLLLRQGVSVQQSGEQSGFVNNSAFITAFRRFVGVPPGRYKKRFRDSMLVGGVAKGQ